MRVFRTDAVGESVAASKALLLDARLSYAARGLLLEILARPEGWEANADELSREARLARGDTASEGRRAVRALFGELEAVGYMRRTRHRNSSGTFYTVLEVGDSPEALPHPQRSPVERAPFPTRRQESVVYVIGDGRSRVVKIGTTSNLRSRLKGLQTGSAYELRVLWSFGGDVRLEEYLHRRYGELRLEGEWFDFGDDDPVERVMATVDTYYLVPLGTCASWS
ncbi:GIY-YIG nuclease family protein [Streptomyces sp. NBC_01716]|uniref:GIY-YIG nuclease family protein n=1 Tax=Streptomyces sp. NBC_01716 TaxID=2975917 RepID=UPI002E353D57|nr:GIY-YIG nuclease family protein [Streptomyces sp. NBC_01716]